MQALAQAAAAARVDTIRAGAAVAWLERYPYDSSAEPLRFYPTKDHIHPSAIGAEILANAVEVYLARRLACVSASASSGAAAPIREPGVSAAKDAETSPRPWEICINSAVELPVAQNRTRGDWTLIDLGKHKKVEKLGLVSNAAGDRLSLGPLPTPTSSLTGCGAVDFCLNFLLSSDRFDPPNGVFTIECSGCDCAPSIDKYHYGLNPFPLVHTSAARASNLHYRHVNVSVTELTCFKVLWRSAEPCHVEVVNGGRPWSKEPVRSRVQIDSLALNDARLTLGGLSHMHAKPEFYRPTRGANAAKAWALRGLQCLPRVTVASECAVAAQTHAGYELKHVQDLCATIVR